MRSRILVCRIASFLACLAFVAGCGPSFKSGRDKDPNQTTQAPTPPPSESPEAAPVAPEANAEDAADGSQGSTEIPGAEAETERTASLPLPITGESKLLADKLVVGVSLEKIGTNHKVTAVLKDKPEDQKPKIELSALIDTTISNGSVSADKIEFAQIGAPPFSRIDEAQYSVDYRCLAADCASIEVDIQRMTGDRVGYRASMIFETKDNAFVLKQSSLTGTLLTANAARELADPMVGVDPVDAVASPAPPALAVTPSAATSPTPAPVTAAPAGTPAPARSVTAPDAAAKAAAEKAAKERRELVGRLNALPKPIIRHKMPTCDKNSQAYKNAAILLKKKVVAAQILRAEQAGIRLTAKQKADALDLKPNAVIVSREPSFPVGSRCNPRPTAAAARTGGATRAGGQRAQAPRGSLAHPLTFVGPKY